MSNSRKCLIIILTHFSFLISNTLNSQTQILRDSYTSFDGRSVGVRVIQGRYTVVCFDSSKITSSQLIDTTTLSIVVTQIDSMYAFYSKFFGREPSGGWSKYSNKCAVAFVPPSCGAACGLVGAKGVEIDPGMLTQILNEQKYPTKTYRIGIVSYEFGRNFFTFGNKVLFPVVPGSDQINGGFAEGFASFASVLEFIDQGNRKPVPYFDFHETYLNYDWLVNSFRAYINDSTSSPDSNLNKNKFIFDINRSYYGNYYGVYSGPIIFGTHDLFKNQINWSEFFNYLSGAPDATTKEIAMGNIALGFSKAIKLNLNAYFKNVLKFKYDSQFENSIKNFPNATNKLIKDKSTLYFTDIYDTISLNVKSINHQSDPSTQYLVLINGVEFSKSSHGLNMITYNDISSKDSINLSVYLLENGNRIDSQKIVIKKRSSVRLTEFKDQLFFVSGNGTSIPRYTDSTFYIESVSNVENYPLFELIFPVKRNQKYRISASMSTNAYKSSNNQDANGDGIIDYWSSMSIGGGGGSDGTVRVGYDVRVNDSSFYQASAIINTNSFFNQSWSKDIKYMLQKIYLFAVGVGRYKYKEIEVKNITDTDGDGIVDFEDSCPFLPNPLSPNVSNISSCIGSMLAPLTATPSSGNAIRWYGTNSIGGISSNVAPTPSTATAGTTTYYVSQVSVNGCESDRAALRVTINPLPTKPNVDWNGIDLSTSQGYFTYQWLLNNVEISGATNNLFRPLQSGSYRIKVSNSFGCVDTSAIREVVVTSVETFYNGSKVKIYPNPSINNLFVDLGKNPTKKIFAKLIQSDGKIIKELQFTKRLNYINISDCPSGNYTIHLSSERLIGYLRFIKY